MNDITMGSRTPVRVFVGAQIAIGMQQEMQRQRDASEREQAQQSATPERGLPLPLGSAHQAKT
jgi:hypothetical protein